ncbi:TIGR04086 family membrane protein [Paenibacillus sp. IB182496]|uniref:TIGR04086 family membrane protein n=1 Tax=Paenibacillus sabuli TaxID=2772509 RepID=A0A927GRC1_9BACL|nr:TIGR04086 family membrane protein [Paenibacillus sabuli]MBD2844577.1 TIGR04086 family membrane protein [Paenibacillus sabuli]
MKAIKEVPRLRIASPLLSGLMYAALWLLGCTLLMAGLLYFSGMQEAQLPGYVSGAHALCALAGGFVSGKRAQRKGWSHGISVGLVYGLAIVLIGFLAMDAALTLRTLITLAAAALAGAAGGMIGVNARA